MHELIQSISSVVATIFAILAFFGIKEARDLQKQQQNLENMQSIGNVKSINITSNANLRKEWRRKWRKYGLYGGAIGYLILNTFSGEISQKINAHGDAYTIGYYGAGTIFSAIGGLIVGAIVGYTTSIFIKSSD
ncbi:MAG: hypothetical protein KJ914_04570 [Gammaproteobacteria bacterium]|nr:hypothetical protein [Gammaproteobacteria bacterium]MBU1724582.1 hypothetical protein [Gammaproteobacteria bacterium]MBU2004625.1 hypothetical protein [Gammaproteobacteria bacterium]